MFILIAGGLFSLWVSFFLSSAALEPPYAQVFELMLGGFFGLFGIAALFSILAFDSILIYKDRVEIKSILGFLKRTIYLKDIVGYTEIEKKNKYLTWTDLTIYTDRTKYKLSSNLYSNYIQLKFALISGKKEDHTERENWFRKNSRIFGIVFFSLAIACFVASYRFYIKAQSPVSPAALKTIKGVITNEAEIHKGSKGSRSILIYLKEYPYFQFQVDGNAYSAAHSNMYVERVNPGDTLYLEIEMNEYLMKLTRLEEPAFWTKHVNYKFIRVYGLCDKNECYLSVANYVNETRADAPWGIGTFAVIGLILVGSGINQFYSRR
jgi:hypothetical protein